MSESAAKPRFVRGEGNEPKALETKRCSVGRFSFDYFPLSAQRKGRQGSGPPADAARHGAGTAPGLLNRGLARLRNGEARTGRAPR